MTDADMSERLSVISYVDDGGEEVAEHQGTANWLISVADALTTSHAEDIFELLIQRFSTLFSVSCAFVSECLDDPPTRGRTLAYWKEGRLEENFEFEFSGTPCEKVMTSKDLVHYPRGVQTSFPAEVGSGYESYVGIPVLGHQGDIIGHLAMFDSEDVPDATILGAVFKIFAVRAASELERRRAEEGSLRFEQRFTRFFEHANVPMFLIDPAQDQIIDANPRACELLSYAREEIHTQHISDVHPDEMKKFMQFAESAIRGGHARTEELTCLTRSGQRIPVEILASIFTDTHGDRELLLTSVHSIEAINRANQEIDRLRQQNELILRAAGEGIYGLDRSGNITFINPAAEAITGWSHDELIGRNMHKLMHHSKPDGTRYPKSECPIYSPIYDGVMHHRDDEVFWCKDGSSTPVEYTSTPIIEDGRSVGVVVMFRDITERKRSEEALQKANHELKRLKERLQAENTYLQEEILTDHNYQEMIGKSRAHKHVLEQIEQVAVTDATVLVLGETGTGKELVARAIHNLSERRNLPLVKVNCGAITSGLVESELFGHEKGAFTGASQRRIGRFELADRGTIFLDEVAELSAETQVKLLRVLQEQEFERVGGIKSIRVNVRVIAATNRNLMEAVGSGRFRSDLFYRLNVFPIEMPPLRERKEDIPLLISHFLAKLCKKLDKSLLSVSDQSMLAMMAYEWPGNIRELHNIIERAAIVSKNSVLEVDALLAVPVSLNRSTSGGTLDDVQRVHILNVLESTGWVIAGCNGAAVQLGVNANTLRSRMRKLGIFRTST